MKKLVKKLALLTNNHVVTYGDNIITTKTYSTAKMVKQILIWIVCTQKIPHTGDKESLGVCG